MAGSRDELRSAENEAKEVLKRALTAVCLEYDGPLQALLEALEQSSHDYFKESRTLTCDPPCNPRQIAVLFNLEHDF